MTYEELVALSDAVAEHLVAVPADAPDVCPHCHSAKDPAFPLCYSCGQIEKNFGFWCVPVIPISFYTTPPSDQPVSPLRELMHDYKEHADPARRAEAASIVAAILVRYIVEHREALIDRFGGWDLLVPIPSTKVPGANPLADALTEYTQLIEPPDWSLRVGTGPIERFAPAVDGFDAIEDISGRRVLIVDDTFTTGAHLHSAAHTLVGAEADVVGAVVVARKINLNPRYGFSIDVWERQASRPFSFTDAPFWR